MTLSSGQDRSAEPKCEIENQSHVDDVSRLSIRVNRDQREGTYLLHVLHHCTGYRLRPARRRAVLRRGSVNKGRCGCAQIRAAESCRQVLNILYHNESSFSDIFTRKKGISSTRQLEQVDGKYVVLLDVEYRYRPANLCSVRVRECPEVGVV